MISSFRSGASAAIIGASGAIGGALVEQLGHDERVACVHAFARQPGRVAGADIAVHPLDVTDEDSIRAAAEQVAEPLDLVIVASGVLHRADSIRPEKSMRELDKPTMLEVFAINTVGPALVAKHFLPKLAAGRKTVFAALSARVGSIGDNRLGGWSSYRASKAALNMLVANLAIEHARRRPESAVVALHPGTVDSALSKPFTGKPPLRRVFSPPEAAAYLLRVIDGLSADDTGGFFAWDGARIVY